MIQNDDIVSLLPGVLCRVLGMDEKIQVKVVNNMTKWIIYGICNKEFFDVRKCEFAYTEEEKIDIINIMTDSGKYDLIQVDKEE